MKQRLSIFAEVGHVAAVVSSIIHTVDEEWLKLATRPSFSEMLGELGEYTLPSTFCVWVNCSRETC